MTLTIKKQPVKKRMTGRLMKDKLLKTLDDTFVVATLASIAVVALITGLLALSSWVTMWAWNTLMPTVFDLPEISQWQAFALYLLVGVVFRFAKSKD